MTMANDTLVGIDIRTWSDPQVDMLPKGKRANFRKRRDALIAVTGGSSFRAAGRAHEVDPRVVQKDAQQAVLLHPDGKPWGFRACIPYKIRQSRLAENTNPKPPTNKRPHALLQLLASSKEISMYVDGYSGSLPTGKAACRSFDKHVKGFHALVRRIHGDNVYPFDVPDHGRRALLHHHRKIRQQRLEAGAADVDMREPEIRRFNQLFQIGVLDRVEFDAHKTDVDWQMLVPGPNGQTIPRHIKSITLYAMVCSVSRYLISYVLIFGEPNKVDVLRLFSRSLRRWKRRSLIVPKMEYPDGAILGLPEGRSLGTARAIVTAGDNALAHHAELTRGNLLNYQRGIIHFGPAHVPETRPIIEAFFRRLEHGALRQIAGAFQPADKSDPKVATSYLRAEDHPLHWEALYDLIDVIAAGYNVTQHSGLGDRTPAEVLQEGLRSAWAFSVSDPEKDADRLTTIRFKAKIRGNKGDGRHPFIEYKGARYRSQRLMGQWGRIGQYFQAEANIEDLRHVVLLDPKEGIPWSRLAALSPWNRSPHDLNLRQQVIRARSRKLLVITGAEDAVAAYHEFVRGQVRSTRGPADALARLESRPRVQEPGPAMSTKVSRPPPRSGRTSFANRKD